MERQINNLSNIERANLLKAHYLKQIQKLIELHEGQNQLGIYIYGNENTLQSILTREKKSRVRDKNGIPWKVMSLLRILLDYDLVKKGARECRLTKG